MHLCGQSASPNFTRLDCVLEALLPENLVFWLFSGISGCHLAADLGELEHAFEDAEDVLDATADLGLDTVTSALDLVYDALISIVAVREAAGLGDVLPEDIGLTLIGRVAPYSGLFAVEEIGQDGGVMDVGSGRYYSVNHLGFSVDAYVGLHPEVPLVALLGLVHVGVPGLILVLGG